MNSGMSSEQMQALVGGETVNEYDKAEIHVDLLVRAQKAAENAELVLDSYNEGEFTTTTFSAKMKQATAYATLSLALSKLAES